MPTPTRFHMRTYRRVPLQGRVVFLNEGLKGSGCIWNLSLEGCRVDAEQPVPAGTEVSLLLHLPEAGAPIEIDHAVVAWSHGQEMGFRLDEIRTIHANRLTAYLCSLN